MKSTYLEAQVSGAGDFNARPSPLPFQSDARTAAAVAAAAKLDRLDSNKEFIGPDDL